MPWILTRKRDGVDVYWTGRAGRNGGPSETPWKQDAFHFGEARSARECADTHDGLRNSDDWRPVKR